MKTTIQCDKAGAKALNDKLAELKAASPSAYVLHGVSKYKATPGVTREPRCLKAVSNDNPRASFPLADAQKEYAGLVALLPVERAVPLAKPEPAGPKAVKAAPTVVDGEPVDRPGPVNLAWAPYLAALNSALAEAKKAKPAEHSIHFVVEYYVELGKLRKRLRSLDGRAWHAPVRNASAELALLGALIRPAEPVAAAPGEGRELLVYTEVARRQVARVRELLAKWDAIERGLRDRAETERVKGVREALNQAADAYADRAIDLHAALA